MRTFTSYRTAVAAHREDGGFLLALGEMPVGTLPCIAPRPAGAVVRPGAGPIRSVWRRVYAVCDEADAIDLGRTPEQLAALAPTYREGA